VIYIYFTGRIKHKSDIVEACMLMLTELCPDAEHDVDIDINLLHHLDQQMAGYCWGDSELIHIDLARHSYDTTFTRDDILLHLTHELIHAKQLINNQYDYAETRHLPYIDLPWEKEAFGIEEAMCKKYFKIG
jgi:hypothetical protein